MDSSSLEVAVAIRTVSGTDISEADLLFCCCDGILWQKQLKGESIYFGSWLTVEGASASWWEVLAEP